MEQDDKPYEQVFRQGLLKDPLEKTKPNKDNQSSQKKGFLIAMIGTVVTLLVVIIMISIMSLSNDGGIATGIDADKTILMTLYDQLNDKMTYQELETAVKEVAPEASIVFDDGVYIITAEGEDDYITCNIEKSESAEVEEGISQGGLSEEGEVVEDEAGLEELVNTIMSEPESEEDEEEETYDTSGDSYGETIKTEPDMVMAHFVYYCYGGIETLNGNTELTELYIQESSDGEGYVLFNGVDVVVLPTKAVAIGELLSLIEK